MRTLPLPITTVLDAPTLPIGCAMRTLPLVIYYNSICSAMRTLPLVIYYNSICRVRNAHLTITDRK